MPAEIKAGRSKVQKKGKNGGLYRASVHLDWKVDVALPPPPAEKPLQENASDDEKAEALKARKALRDERHAQYVLEALKAVAERLAPTPEPKPAVKPASKPAPKVGKKGAK